MHCNNALYSLCRTLIEDNMNSNQAKQLDFPLLLSKMGYEPQRTLKGGKELFYKSPFREEKDASFHVSNVNGQWLWFDFAQDGGNILDFVMQYQNCSVKEALAFLRDKFPGPLFDTAPSSATRPKKSEPNLFSFHQQTGGEAAPRDLEFISEKPLQSPMIFKYLAGRGIPKSLAQRYLKLIHYRNLNRTSAKPFFGFGQMNRGGGYELRSAADGSGAFKSALICRDISVHPGLDPDFTEVSVFEGMLDHLSMLVMLDLPALKGESIVLNALSSYERAKAYIESRKTSRINLFLDNDESGQKAVARFQEDFGDRVVNYAPRFLPHKDLNEALVAGLTPNFSSRPQPPQP